MEAATTYCRPRIWPTVLAFAGDSTITKRLPSADGILLLRLAEVAVFLDAPRDEPVLAARLLDCRGLAVVFLVPVFGGMG
jgi:hypothetical protein